LIRSPIYTRIYAATLEQNADIRPAAYSGRLLVHFGLLVVVVLVIGHLPGY